MRNNLILAALAFSLFLSPDVSARTSAVHRGRMHRSHWIRCTATAYSVRGETADGDVTKYRQTVAADPAVIPLGSKVRIEGAGSYSGVYKVTDTGRKLHGRSVDIFIPSAAAAKQFGRKPVRVRILSVGDEKVGEKEPKTSRGSVARR